jgi:hypothetical protein
MGCAYPKPGFYDPRAIERARGITGNVSQGLLFSGPRKPIPSNIPGFSSDDIDVKL